MKTTWAACGFLMASAIASTASADIWAPLVYNGFNNRLYSGPYTQNFTNINDWAFGNNKAECGPLGANRLTTMVGVSFHVGSTSCGIFGTGCFTIVWNNAILCSTSNIDVDQFNETRVSVPIGGSVMLDQTWGDWAFGFSKIECGANQVMTGLAGRNALCSTGRNLAGAQACYVRWFDRVNSQPPVNRGDWDFGSYKGECSFGEYIKGVAMNAAGSGGQTVGLHCCQPVF